MLSEEEKRLRHNKAGRRHNRKIKAEEERRRAKSQYDRERYRQKKERERLQTIMGSAESRDDDYYSSLPFQNASTPVRPASVSRTNVMYSPMTPEQAFVAINASYDRSRHRRDATQAELAKVGERIERTQVEQDKDDREQRDLWMHMSGVKRGREECDEESVSPCNGFTQPQTMKRSKVNHGDSVMVDEAAATQPGPRVGHTTDCSAKKKLHFEPTVVNHSENGMTLAEESAVSRLKDSYAELEELTRKARSLPGPVAAELATQFIEKLDDFQVPTERVRTLRRALVEEAKLIGGD